MPERTAHEVTLRLHRSWNEYRADCSCGWTGSYFARESAALREGELHVESGVDE